MDSETTESSCDTNFS